MVARIIDLSFSRKDGDSTEWSDQMKIEPAVADD